MKFRLEVIEAFLAGKGGAARAALSWRVVNGPASAVDRFWRAAVTMNPSAEALVGSDNLFRAAGHLAARPLGGVWLIAPATR